MQPTAGLGFRTGSPFSASYIVEIVAVTAALLLAAYGILWLIRRTRAQPPRDHAAGKLKLVDQLRVGPNTRMSVIEYNGIRLLLAESNRHINVREISETPAAE